jgi:hypothetical protein
MTAPFNQFSPEGCGNPTGVCQQAGGRGRTPLFPVCSLAFIPADKTVCYPKSQSGAEPLCVSSFSINCSVLFDASAMNSLKPPLPLTGGVVHTWPRISAGFERGALA